MATRRLHLIIAAAIAWCASSAYAGEPRDKAKGTERDADCFVCHAGVGEEDAPKLDPDLYAETVHGDVGCVSCHPDVEDLSIKHHLELDDLEPADCASCHEDQGALFQKSIHNTSRDEAKKKPTCASCHGMHDILPADDLRARTHVLNQLSTCGECHEKDSKAGEHERVSAGCSDCHRAHDVLPAEDPGSSLFLTTVVDTCGKCHEHQRADYRKSVHADALNDPTKSEKDPAVCISCHPVHRGITPKSPEFSMALVKECGNCHSELLASYQESYHGKAQRLGDEAAAKCADCHDSHAILARDNPGSSIHPDNKAEMCRTCHPSAPDQFAGFWAHADPHDREQYPLLFYIWAFMTALLIGVCSFFGLHTLLWALREAHDAWRDRKQPKKHAHGGPLIQRFTFTDRVVHAMVMVSFLGLAATGAPLKFAQTAWAQVIFDLLGGVAAAGWWHRVFGIITFGYFATHVVSLARRFWAAKKEGKLLEMFIGPDTLVPRLQDVIDVVKHMLWFVGLGSRPKWDRWTYWEKFDYWAVFWGVAMIGGSGLVLWFPEFFTHLLPGWAVNIALIIHSDEALLAISFIFGVHFFNSHLRRSKFPMDAVIFTGTMPEEEFKEERSREWERLKAEGRLEARRGEPPTKTFLQWARVIGISAWLTGLVILALIIHGVFLSH